MIVRPALAAVAAAVLLASCGSAPTEDSSTRTPSASSDTGVASSPSSPSPAGTVTAGGESAGEQTVGPGVVQVGTLVPRSPARTIASGWITRKAGGTIEVELDDGETATLKIPPRAVVDGVIVTLSTFTSGSVIGLRMEPDGLWLTRPALLTIQGAPRLLTRIGALPDGDLFAPGVPVVGGSIPIVRLRPVIIDDESVTPTEVAGGSGTSDGGSGGQAPAAQEPDPFGPRDPSDEGAQQAEADAATEAANEGTDMSEVEVTTTDDVREQAAAAAAAMSQRCKDPKDPASVRLAAARRTAGAQAPAELPDCITRVVRVLGMYESENITGEQSILGFTETVGGMGEVSSSGEEISFPLEGVFAKAADNPLDCSVGRMEGGTMSARLQVRDDDGLELTLQPKGGNYAMWCPKISATGESGVWFAVRELAGMGEDEPFVLTFPPGRTSTNVLSSLEISETLGGRFLPNGEYVFDAEIVRGHVLMVVDLYESMEEYRETQKVWESHSPSAS